MFSFGIRACAQNFLELPCGLAGLAGVRLIYNHRIPTLADFRFPSLGLRSLLGGGGFLRLGPSGAQQPAQYEREFLERGDDDLGTVD